MNVIDWHYKLSPTYLHQVRVNRTRRQRGGGDEYGNKTPNSALDLHMERLMPILKSPVHNNTKESWIQLGKVMPFCMRSKAFTEYEYSQRSDYEYSTAEKVAEATGEGIDDLQLADPMQKLKPTTEPRAVLPLVLLTEAFVQAGLATEVASRQYNGLHFWKAFDSATTSVKKTKRTEAAAVSDKNAKDSTEEHVVETVDVLAAEARKARAANKEATQAITEPMGIGDDDKSVFDDDDEEEPFEDFESALDEEDNDDNDNGEETPDDTGPVVDEEEDDIAETQLEDSPDLASDEEGSGEDVDQDEQAQMKALQKRVQTIMLPLNRLGTKNYLEEARAQLLEKDLCRLRRLQREREDRANLFLKAKLCALLDSMEAQRGRNQERGTTRRRARGAVLFDDLKKKKQTESNSDNE
jgi:hypothetical protein